MRTFLSFLVLILGISTLAPATVVEDFNADPHWTYQAVYGGSSESWAPTFPGGTMLLQPDNVWKVRAVTPFTLPGDFTVVVTGTTATGNSQWGPTHIKHYASVIQNGSTSDPNLQLRAGSTTVYSYFTDDIHYNIDLGIQVGLNTAFTVKFVRSGNTISTYKTLTGTDTLLDSYTIVNPTGDFYLELADLDDTSFDAGYSTYDSVTIIPEPATMFFLVLSGFSLVSRQKRRK